MPRYALNRRTLQFEPVYEPKPTREQLLAKVKRVHFTTIRDYDLKDQDIKDLIEQVVTGTRNIHYLKFKGKQMNARLLEIGYFLLREYR